jgi:hypothetical protein
VLKRALDLPLGSMPNATPLIVGGYQDANINCAYVLPYSASESE